MKPEKISEFTTQRLSVYLRCLDALEEAGVETTSSKMLAERFNLNSAQIRKDLAYFGQFGVRGVGYTVKDLRQRLANILGLNNTHNVAIVGAGNLGMALTEYGGFQKTGFRVVAVFDSAPGKIGSFSRSGVPIYDVRELPRVVAEKQISMAVISVPADAAQQVCNQLMDSGVRAILNFAPNRLVAREGVKIKSIDLSISLESLSFFLSASIQDTLVQGEVLRDTAAGSLE
jgi:redox-sensing transcriptional repressor